MTKRKTPENFLPNGRPTMYRPEFCQDILDFFNVTPFREITTQNEKTGNEITKRIANTLPTLAGYASRVGVSRAVLNNWGKAYPEFLYAMTCAKAMAEHMIVTNALLGLYNANFAQFVARNYTDLRDVQEFRDLADSDLPDTPEEIDRRIAELDKEIAALQAQL